MERAQEEQWGQRGLLNAEIKYLSQTDEQRGQQNPEYGQLPNRTETAGFSPGNKGTAGLLPLVRRRGPLCNWLLDSWPHEKLEHNSGIQLSPAPCNERTVHCTSTTFA